MTNDDPIAVAHSTLTERTSALQRATDPTACGAELTEKMRDFEPGERFAYAPETEKIAVRRRIKDEQLERAGFALTALEDIIRDHEELLPGILADVQQPPSAIKAATARFGDLKATDLLLVELLHEQKLSRCQRELSDAFPSKVLTVYEQAIDGDDATVVAFIERAHGNGWSGKSAESSDSNTLEAQAAIKLARAIREARSGRVSMDLRQWESMLKKARTACQRARDLHHVEPRRKQVA